MLDWASVQLREFKARIGSRGRDWTVDYPAWREDDPRVTVHVRPDETLEAFQDQRLDGTIDARQAWWFINLRAMLLVARQFSADVVYREIVERIEELEAAGHGPIDPNNLSSEVSASSEWRVLNAARYRRMGVYTRHVLRAAGEDEMVRVMLEDPEEYRRRAEACEWSSLK